MRTRIHGLPDVFCGEKFVLLGCSPFPASMCRWLRAAKKRMRDLAERACQRQQTLQVKCGRDVASAGADKELGSTAEARGNLVGDTALSAASRWASAVAPDQQHFYQCHVTHETAAASHEQFPMHCSTLWSLRAGYGHIADFVTRCALVLQQGRSHRQHTGIKVHPALP